MLTATQKKTAQAIVNIFETGVALGEYGDVTLIAGDTGHLTFGRSQTTLGSGNLAMLLARYCANAGARFSAQLKPYLPRFEACDLSLDHEPHLHNILRASADDPVMRETQDVFFDEVYWAAAERAAKPLGIVTPLGMAVVYDSMVHGAFKLIRDRTNAKCGSPGSAGEQAWISEYVAQRDAWLRNNPRADLRGTVYRMEAMRRLIELKEWGLDLPLVVRGVEVSAAALSATPPHCYDGPAPGSRALGLQSPLARGLDVRLLQLGLSAQGAEIKADGVFGKSSGEHIKTYQKKKGLPPTGIADAALVLEIVG